MDLLYSIPFCSFKEQGAAGAYGNRNGGLFSVTSGDRHVEGALSTGERAPRRLIPAEQGKKPRDSTITSPERRGGRQGNRGDAVCGRHCPPLHVGGREFFQLVVPVRAGFAPSGSGRWGRTGWRRGRRHGARLYRAAFGGTVLSRGRDRVPGTPKGFPGVPGTFRTGCLSTACGLPRRRSRCRPS